MVFSFRVGGSALCLCIPSLRNGALILQCQLRYAASSAESFYYPGPEPFFEPLAVPTVDRAVWPELLFWQVSPRRTAFHDPQYPAKHLPVVASGASFARLLPRQQLPDALPLGIAEKTGGSIGTKVSSSMRYLRRRSRLVGGYVLHDHLGRWRVLPRELPRGSALRPLGGLDETATILAETPFALPDPSSRGSAALPPVWWAGSARGRNASRDPPFCDAFLIFGDRAHHRQVSVC